MTLFYGIKLKIPNQTFYINTIYYFIEKVIIYV